MQSNNLNLSQFLDQLSEVIAEKISGKISPSAKVKTSKDAPQEEYLDTIQTLEFINVKTRVTLDKYVLEGRIEKPIKRGGRKLYYKKSNLIKFLQNG
jgi:hypothetical protein